MKSLILCCAISLLMLHAGAQSAKKTRTITASFSKNGITSGDTTFFSYYGPAGTLERFFYRNLRIPSIVGTMELEYGSCNLYFMIDTAGNVTKTWCDSVTNTVIEKEVLRVANKLAWLKPTKIKGKPVVTNVMATIIMIHNEVYDKNQKADIVLMGYEPKRKTTAR